MTNFLNDQRRPELIKMLLSNPEMSTEKAMVAVGYSPSYAKASTTLINSKTFQELLAETIPDEESIDLLKVLMSQRQKEFEQFDLDTPDEEILLFVKNIGGEYPRIHIIEVDEWIGEGKKRMCIKVEKKSVGYVRIDSTAINNALDKVFKLKGAYAPEKKSIVGMLGIAQLLDQLQDEDGTTHRPEQSSGDPIRG